MCEPMSPFAHTFRYICEQLDKRNVKSIKIKGRRVYFNATAFIIYV